MKLNFRAKLFLLLLGFILFIIAFGIFSNAYLLEGYYIVKYKGVLQETGQSIQEKYINNIGKIESYILNIERNDGISVTITDDNCQMQYVSYPNRIGVDDLEFPKQVARIIEEYKNKDFDAICEVEERKKEQVPKYIFYLERMEHGGFLILIKSMKGIGESVQISNTFYLYVGAFMVVIGLVVTVLFSNRISSPIIKMSRVARHISNLDFAERIEVRTQDEIGMLGKSINEISEKLSNSIDNMKNDIERRKQLARDISHELKTPIGVIKGYAEGLRFGVATSKEMEEKYCRVIAEECDRMDVIVKRLLELSMLEDASLQPKLTKFKLEPLLRSIKVRFEHNAKERALDIGLSCESGLQIAADYELLERVISNFVSNAVKYTNDQGQILISACTADKRVIISVYNTGSCIPEEELEHIWDVFYRIDKARSRSSGGHGIGLSIAKQIARVLKGDTFARNETEGVTFWIDIPSDLLP